MQEDPERWLPPLSGHEQMTEGERLWRSAPLRATSLSGAPAIRAHCGDCHAQDGQDLKYFNYSNLSIVVRSQFHGLSQRQDEQIASYIRSLDLPHPGRPWNPPYQPGPGMQTRAAAELAAGAGLKTIDPRMMVAPEWSQTFAGLPAAERRAITQAWLRAWLDKCGSYPLAAYFHLSQLPGSYELPQDLRAISGGNVWQSAFRFRAAGVDAKLVERLELWGREYMAMSSLFQY